ncbi:MAG: hypothetical protein IJX40_06825 [Alistipes sp.]|nr:hypothetical protein [Alistipes sp.]
MKKFYSFVFAAVALVGFAACNSDSVDEAAPVQKGETVSFIATIDNTRTGLDGLQTTWVNGDKVVIGDYTFTYDGSKFSCTADGVKSLLNTEVTATYSKNGDGKVDSTAGVAGAVLEAKGTLTQDGTLNFNIKSAFLKYTYNGNSALVVSLNGESVSTQTGTDVYVAFMPEGVNTLAYTLDGVTCKSKDNFAPVAGKIYKLGDLTPKTTVYLIPGVWASDGPKFSVYYWNGAFNDEVVMTKDETKNGVYMAEIYENAEGLIFKRLSPTDNKEWNKTGDLTLPTDNKDHYYITGWGAADGEWREYVRIEWSVSGTFNTWGDTAMTRINETMSVAQGIALTAYSSQFKIKDATSWDTNYGAGYGYMLPGHYMTATYNGGEIVVTETGTYDIYFNEVDTIIYVVAAGADYTTAVEQTANGPAPVTGNIYYFKPNSNWTQSSAKFSGYFWNSAGNKWAELTDTDKDGIYECNLGEWTPTYVIFLRKDPSGFVYNNWTCWDRIGNITVPSGKNFYTMASGVWSQEIGTASGYTGGTWGTK